MCFSQTWLVRLSVQLSATTAVIGGIASLSIADAESPIRSLADKLSYGPGVTNHPVGVIPSPGIKIPEGWPLDVDGSITCLTCHATLPSLAGESSAHLRGYDKTQPIGTIFCAKCHTDEGARTREIMHWMAVGVAHVRSDADRTQRSLRTLDQESQRCLGCHDGVTASDARNSASLSHASRDFSDVQKNHPIGLPYTSGLSRNRTSLLRPVSHLPPEVRLPNDSVSCVSCHDLYASSRGLLTVPIHESRLCFTCHDL